MRVKCLAQEHNTMTQPGLEPGPLDPESSLLTTRPLPLRHSKSSQILWFHSSVDNVQVSREVTSSSPVEVR